MAQRVLYNNNGRADSVTLQASSVDLGNVTNDAQVKKIASSTDNAIMVWSGASGDLPKDSNATIDGSGNITTTGSITAFNVIESNNLVYENILASTITTATDITISDLDLNLDREYIVQIIASNTNTGTIGHTYCYLNGDKTAGNYVGFGNSFSPAGLVWSGATSTIEIGYLAKSGTVNSQFRVVRNGVNGYLNYDTKYFDNRPAGAVYWELNYGEYKVNVENLTSIILTVSYMTAGSIIRVFRKINRSADLITVKSFIEAKGDLLVGTSSEVIARQSVGTNGQIIVADDNLTNGLGYKDPTFRNQVMNGNMEVSQRGTSWANPTTGTYTMDRMKVAFSVDGGTNPTVTHSQQSVTPGVFTKSKNFYRIAVDGAGSSYGANSYYVVQHSIENGTRLLCGDGRKVTFSVLANTSIASNKLLGVHLIQNYGTGGSPTAQEAINGTYFTLTSTLTEYTFTFTTNTLSGKTFGTNNDDRLILSLDFEWGSTFKQYPACPNAETFVGSGNINFGQLALYVGDVAYPFEPVPFDIELQRCMRYYEKSYNYNVYPGTAATDGNSIFIPAGGNCTVGDYIFLETKYKVTKRIAGTPIVYDTDGTINKVTLCMNNTSATPNISGVVFSPTINNFGCYGITTNVAHRGIQYAWYVDADF